jgi:hypothetical protein
MGKKGLWKTCSVISEMTTSLCGRISCTYTGFPLSAGNSYASLFAVLGRKYQVFIPGKLISHSFRFEEETECA